MRDTEWWAKVVRPLIEARVREDVARELEAQPCAEHGTPRCHAADCAIEMATWREAAELARGERP